MSDSARLSQSVIRRVIVPWDPDLHAAFESSKSHMVIHALTDGFLEEGTVVMTEARRNLFPAQRNLKLYLAGLRVARVSHIIKDYYRMIKDLLDIAFRPCTDFHWSESTEYA